MNTSDRPEMDFSGPERRLRVDGDLIGHHQSLVRRRWGPIRVGMTSVGHSPEMAYAAAERAAGRRPRTHPRWFEARPDQTGFWGLWALFMLGFCGYCIDETEWYGVVLFAVLTLTSLLSAGMGWANRHDHAWQVRADIAAMRSQPRKAPQIAQKLSRTASDNPEALGAIADWAYLTGEFSNAEEAVRRYIERVPDDRRAILRLADVQLHRGEPEAAQQTLTHAHAVTGVEVDADILWRVMVARLMNGEPAAAHEAACRGRLDRLSAGDRDWVRYLDALSVAASQGVDGRAEASAMLGELAAAHPDHTLFSDLRDALDAGRDISVDISRLLDCTVTSPQPRTETGVGIG